MIAITSYRPFDKCTQNIKENQLRAHRSWLTAFERIIYVGEFGLELSAISCEFVPGEDRPTIQSLCKIAAQMGTWVAIVNADIVASPKIHEVEQRMNEAGIKCAVSQRYDLEIGFIIDQGLDFFAGVSEVWESAFRKIPPDFRIGFGCWDNWMLGHFCCEYGRKCADITRERLIQHPNHQDRKDPNWKGSGLDHRYIKHHYWPQTILR